MGACAERHILTPECGQFAIAQARLNRYKKQRSVAVADPVSYVRRPYQSGGLALGQKLNRAVLAAFGWDCKNTLTLQKQRRLADCDEPEEGMHGSKPRVACAHRIASAMFEVLQELLDQRHVEVLDSQL